MIVYVGNEIDAGWVRDVAAIRNMEVEFIESSLTIESQMNNILAMRPKYVIYDLIQYTNEPESLARYIRAIENATNAVPILLAGANFGPMTKLIQSLYKAGLKNILFGWSLGDLKEELNLCLDNKLADLIDAKMQGQSVTPDLLPQDKKNDTKKMIGVAGIMHRIGTTTHALQLVKHIELHGKRAAYIELNNTGFIKNLCEWMDAEVTNATLGKTTFSGVDLFSNKSMLPEILEEPYDYFVYDYGAYKDMEFNRTSFLEKDLRVIVCGSSPDEMNASFEILKSAFYKDIEYIFNLVPEVDRKDILNMMDSKAEKTHFGVYAPDPFVLSQTDIYSNLIDLGEVQQPKKKKRRLRAIFK